MVFFKLKNSKILKSLTINEEKTISLNIVKEVWLNDTVFHKVLSFLSQKFLII